MPREADVGGQRKEFADAETAAARGAKSSLGPYPWSRYDIVVLPPSFPLGGAETPRLSFVSPSLIGGGPQSRARVVAQKSAHAGRAIWSSIATWRDRWISEALAGYLQSRIVDAVYGAQRRAVADTLAGSCSPCAMRSRRASPTDQVLAIDLRDRDPGGAFNDAVYEKGRLFFAYLEAQIRPRALRRLFARVFRPVAGQERHDRAIPRLPARAICSTAIPASWRRRRSTPWVLAPGHAGRCAAAGCASPSIRGPGARPLAAGQVAGQEARRARLAAAAVDVFPRAHAADAADEQLAELDQAFAPDAQRATPRSTRSWLHAGDPQRLPARAIARLEDYLQTNGRSQAHRAAVRRNSRSRPPGAALAKRVYSRWRAPAMIRKPSRSSMRSSTPTREGQDDQRVDEGHARRDRAQEGRAGASAAGATSAAGQIRRPSPDGGSRPAAAGTERPAAG